MPTTYRRSHWRYSPEELLKMPRRATVVPDSRPGKRGEFRVLHPPRMANERVYAAAPYRYVLVRGHTVRIPQRPSVGNPRNELAKRQMAALRATRGNKCEVCEATYPPEIAASQLEFAHAAETGLKGMGRGRKERITDIRKHPENYALMCKPCHREFDTLLGPVSK